MPGIHFDITGDNSNIVNVVNDTTQRMENMADLMKGLSNSFDFSDVASSMEALKQAIVGNNEVIAEYKNQLEDLAQKQRDAAMAGNAEDVKKYGDEMTVIAGRIQETVAENEQLIDSLNTIRNSMEGANEEMEESEGIMIKLLGGTKNYNDIVSNLPGPLKQAVTGLNGMVKAAKAFIATPLGAVLAALILAYKTVTTWLHKSAEGQQALARISGYLQGVLTALRQIVMNVGKAIYNAFAHPKEAINSLGQAIKNGIIARLEASKGVIVNFGKMLGSALKGNFKEAGEAAKAMADNFQKQFTGKSVEQIKEGAKGFGEQVAKIHETGKAMSDLSARENKLHRDRTAWAHEEAELDKQIAEERNKLRMGSQADRAAAAKRMQELVDKKTAKNVELAREEYEIKKQTNALSDSSQEDLDEEERLRARVVQLETQGVTQKGFALRIQDSMSRQMGRASEQMKELVERVNEFNESLGEKSEDVQRDAASLVVSSMREGFEKEMAELALEKEQRMAALDKEHKERLKKIESLQKAEYKARHGGSAAGFKFDENNELVIQENTIYGAQVRNEEARTAQQEKNMLDSRLAKYRNFNKQREELEKQYNDDILYLTNELAKAQMDVMTADAGSADAIAAKKRVEEINAALTEAEKKRTEELFKFDTQHADDIKNIFADASTLTLEQINAAIAKAEELLASGKLSIEQTKDVQKALDKLKGTYKDLSVNGLVKIFGKEGSLSSKFKTIGNAWKGMSSEEKWKNIGGWASYMGKGLKEAATYMAQIAEASGNTKLAENAEAVGAISQNLSAAAKGASSGGGWGALAAGLGDMLSQTIESLESYKLSLEITKKAQKDFQEALNAEKYNVNASDYETIFGTKSVEKAADAYHKAMMAIEDYYKYVTKSMDALGKDVTSSTTNRAKELVKAYKKGYSELEATMVRTKTASGWMKLWGGDDKYMSLKDMAPELWDATTGEFNVENAQKFLEAHKNINTEAREAIQHAIDLKKAYDDAMAVVDSDISSNFSSIADTLEEAIYDAVINGSDAWETFDKVGNETIAKLGRKMLKEMMISTYMEQYRDRMREAYKEGDQQTIATQLANITGEMMSGLQNNIPTWIETLKSFYENVGVDTETLKEGSERTGLSQGIATASQDSIDALSGMMTVVQGHTFEIKESLTGFSAQYETLIANTAAMLEHTQGIHVDTTEIKEIQAQIAELSRSINSNVSTIVDRGVIMR